ncbi:MAG TPA: hypothetical protein ENJ23_03530 [Bacteroidetes bacterium]|nr:hypothetical protein [Bacteroidota bacterium]
MAKFSDKSIERIAKTLGAPVKKLTSGYRMVVENPENGHRLALEVYPEISLGQHEGCLISVYTVNSHLQLQFCTGYVLSESLGEVTFYAESGEKISGLIVDRAASCSFYANVDRSTLSGDFSKLGPEVVMSSVALSLAEQSLKAEEE